jgi:hypothetical protein
MEELTSMLRPNEKKPITDLWEEHSKKREELQEALIGMLAEQKRQWD